MMRVAGWVGYVIAGGWLIRELGRRLFDSAGHPFTPSLSVSCLLFVLVAQLAWVILAPSSGVT